MICKYLKWCAVLIFFISCKNTETDDHTIDDEIVLAFADAKQTSITRNISYLPTWEDRIEFEGNYYIPLKTDQKMFSFTADSIKYALDRKIWLKAGKIGQNWKFTILTVLPDDPTMNSRSGRFLYEDWETGRLNYQGYIEDRLFNPNTYIRTIELKGYVKKALKRPPCQTFYFQICAGEGASEICSTRSKVVCGEEGSGGGSGGGGNSGGDNGSGGSSGGSNGGSGNGTTTPPIIPPSPPSKEDKEIIDSLQGYPCAQAVLAKIPNLENKISKWLNKTFANSVNYNIMFRADPKMSDSTDGFFNGYQTNSRSNFTIMLNGKMLKTASQEYIAVTMFHEVLHGFLGAEMVRLRQEGKPEQFAVLYSGWSTINVHGQDRYINSHANFASTLNDLANAVKSLNPSMNNYDALALAKGGVVSNMSTIEQSINQNHKNGSSGTKCK